MGGGLEDRPADLAVCPNVYRPKSRWTSMSAVHSSAPFSTPQRSEGENQGPTGRASRDRKDGVQKQVVRHKVDVRAKSLTSSVLQSLSALQPAIAGRGEGKTMASPEAQRLGTRLDDHHLSETNGRMAVCRRCGAFTDGPEGKHTPRERQLARTSQWLATQSRMSHFSQGERPDQQVTLIP